MTISEGYRQELIKLHTDTKWGISGGAMSGPTIVNFLETHPEVKTILDYGCGEATLKKFVEEKGIEKDWTLYDPAMPEINFKPVGQFDLVITTDVLEHIEPHMIKSVLYELKDLTSDYLINDIACYLTNNKFTGGPYVGQDFHISIFAPDEWRVKLEALNMECLAARPYILEEYKVRFFSVLRRVHA